MGQWQISDSLYYGLGVTLDELESQIEQMEETWKDTSVNWQLSENGQSARRWFLDIKAAIATIGMIRPEWVDR